MIENLKSLGLSTYESRAFYAILKRKHTIKELVKSARIPAGKAYSVAKSLIGKGLIKASDARPKEFFIENASFVIKNLIETKQAAQDEMMSSLQKLATVLDNNQSRSTPFFDVGISNNDNERIQLRTFVEAEKEVLQIINTHHKTKSNRVSKMLWENEIESAVARGVIFKCIYPVNVKLPPILERLSKKNPCNFHIRRLNLDYPRCDIIDGKKTMVKLVHEDPILFGGIIFIENKAFAKNLKLVFSKFWDEAKPAK